MASMRAEHFLYFNNIAIIMMRKRELIALLNLSSRCLVMVERLFLAVPRGCLQFVIVVFPDHTHLLFWPKATVLINFDCAIILYYVFNLKRRRWSDLICQTLRSLPRTQSESLQMSANFIFEKSVQCGSR